MKRYLLLLFGLILLGCGGGGNAGFKLSAASSNVLVGSFSSSDVTLLMDAGFAGTVNLSFEPPAGIALTGSFSPSSLSSASPTSRLTVTAPIGTSPGVYTATVRGTSGAQSQSASVLVTVSSTGGGGGGSGGSISGTASISTAATKDTDFIPGQIIVKFKAGVSLQSVSALQVGGVSLQRVRGLSVERASLYSAPLGVQQTLETVANLSARGDVEYAQPRYRYRIFRAPNDPEYSKQWHYGAMNLPQAWDIERGQTNPVTVAVVDTGILSQHPDFDSARILPGYDMISDPANANDGDGRDNNAEDTGDNPGGQSSYHGTHVSGTILAKTDNGVGVAGISWGARLLPVRVLGTQGGDIVDVVDGMLWAAALPVDGVPNNPNKAAVMNMSLGGPRPCSDDPYYQDAINKVVAAGVIIAVAAGNEAENAAGFSPASCSGVITVGATGPSGGRAPYSNYGSRVDVMAPGGNTSVDFGGVSKGGGVLSTLKNDANRQFNYQFYNGTSMASPHVAGLIALLKSAKPSLTRAEVLDILKRTAHPLDLNKCEGETSPNNPFPPFDITVNDCGAGLVDAFAAIQAINATPTGSFVLSTTPTSLTVAPGGTAQVSVGIERINGFTGSVALSLQGAPAGITAAFTPNPATGSTATLNLSVANTVAAGQYSIAVQGVADGKTASAALVVTVGAKTVISIKGTFVAALYWTGTQFDIDRSGGVDITSDGASASYTIPGLVGGLYRVAGWKDVNNNDKVDAGDYFGAFRVNGQLAYVRPPANSVGIKLDLLVTTPANSVDDETLNALKMLINK